MNNVAYTFIYRRYSFQIEHISTNEICQQYDLDRFLIGNSLIRICILIQCVTGALIEPCENFSIRILFKLYFSNLDLDHISVASVSTSSLSIE